MDCFLCRVRYCVLLPHGLDNPHIGCCSDNSRYHVLQKVIGGVFCESSIAEKSENACTCFACGIQN